MIIKGFHEPAPADTYGGFTVTERPAPRARGEDRMPPPPTGMYAPKDYPPHYGPPERKRGRPLGVVLVGAIGAVALGLGFGVFSRVDLQAVTHPSPRPAPLPVTPSATPSADSLPVAVAERSDDTREISRIAPVADQPRRPKAATTVVKAPAPPPAPRVVTVRRAAPAPPPRLQPVRHAAPLPAARPPLVRTSAPVARPSFDCGLASRRAEHMVCSDAELAALDRRLNRAFNDAIAAGAPRRGLRAVQDHWIVVDREQAARQSRSAVAEVYRERIAELEDLAGG